MICQVFLNMKNNIEIRWWLILASKDHILKFWNREILIVRAFSSSSIYQIMHTTDYYLLEGLYVPLFLYELWSIDANFWFKFIIFQCLIRDNNNRWQTSRNAEMLRLSVWENLIVRKSSLSEETSFPMIIESSLSKSRIIERIVSSSLTNVTVLKSKRISFLI